MLAFLISNFALGASTTLVPPDSGLKQVYVTDQYGNGLLDQAGSIPALSVSLGSSVAKSQVMKTGITTTASVAHNQVLNYTTSTGKTFYITYAEIEGRLSTVSGTAGLLANCALEIPQGTTVASFQLFNATHGAIDRVIIAPAEPIVATSGQIVTGACDPAAATSTVFKVNFGGYEK